MNILMLTTIIPFPTDSGARIRILQSIKVLAKNNTITVIGFKVGSGTIPDIPNVTFIPIPKKHPPKAVTLIKSLFSSRPYECAKFADNRFKKATADVLAEKDYEVIWVHFPFLDYCLEGVNLSKSIVVLDEHNNSILFADSFARSTHSLIKLFGLLNTYKMKKYLPKTFSLYSHHISCSPIDLEHTRNWAPSTINLLYGPNGIDLEYFTPAKRQQSRRGYNILFCGSLDVTMNQDAVMYFAKEIFPLVLRQMPDCYFTICGRTPPSKILSLANSNIIVTGSVDDVREYYNKADVCIAPFRYGGGTKLKILESMAMQVPIVSTTKGCQGISVTHGRNILIADSPSDFSDHIVKVLQDRGLYEHLVKEGNRLAQRYSWHSIYSGIEKKIRQDSNTRQKSRQT